MNTDNILLDVKNWLCSMRLTTVWSMQSTMSVYDTKGETLGLVGETGAGKDNHCLKCHAVFCKHLLPEL